MIWTTGQEPVSGVYLRRVMNERGFEKLKIGDKVVIKDLRDINDTLDEDDECRQFDISFSTDMEQYCGMVAELITMDDSGVELRYSGTTLERWFWSWNWIKPVPAPILLDEDLFVL